VTLTGDGLGTIQQIDNCSCRRLLVSLCTAWWQCTGAGTSINTVTNAADGTAAPVPVKADGQTAVTLTVTGTNLEIGPGVTYSFGSGITVTVANPPSTLKTGLSTVTLTVTAQTTVTPGLYNLTVVNADCSVVIFGNAIQVNPGTSATLASGAATPAAATGGSGGGAKPAPPQNLSAQATTAKQSTPRSRTKQPATKPADE